MDDVYYSGFELSGYDTDAVSFEFYFTDGSNFNVFMSLKDISIDIESFFTYVEKYGFSASFDGFNYDGDYYGSYLLGTVNSGVSPQLAIVNTFELFEYDHLDLSSYLAIEHDLQNNIADSNQSISTNLNTSNTLLQSLVDSQGSNNGFESVDLSGIESSLIGLSVSTFVLIGAVFLAIGCFLGHIFLRRWY